MASPDQATSPSHPARARRRINQAARGRRRRAFRRAGIRAHNGRSDRGARGLQPGDGAQTLRLKGGALAVPSRRPRWRHESRPAWSQPERARADPRSGGPDHEAFAQEDEAEARAFFVLTFEAAGPIPTLRPWCREWWDRYQSQMEETLRAGRDQTDQSAPTSTSPSRQSCLCPTGWGSPSAGRSTGTATTSSPKPRRGAHRLRSATAPERLRLATRREPTGAGFT